jgi:hypothetical protein
LLAPGSIEDIDKKIEELKDREKLFERGCQQEEEVAEEDKKMLDDIKSKKPAPKITKITAKSSQDDFPSI